jgi:dihydrofolate reductase
MSKVLWHTQMSLDGFIAGPNDDMRWAFEAESGGPDETIDEVLERVGALLVGRRTQDIEDRERQGFYGGAYNGPFFVLRHDPPEQPPVVKGVTGVVLDVSIEEAVERALSAAGGKDVVILGANIARQCLAAGLLDEIIIHLTPVLLGGGVRLFDQPDGRPVKLKRTFVTERGQLTALGFEVID